MVIEYLFRQVYFPYCLKRQADGSYVVLNRKYKPLGMAVSSGRHIEYGEHPVSVQINDMTPDLARQLSCRGSADLDEVFLYDDGTNPDIGGEAWAAYGARLQLLSKLHVTWVEDR